VKLGKFEAFAINLPRINHVFKKGRRIMVQVRSSWFPIIDRNPQKYVRNIFEAGDGDFMKAEETVYFDGEHATRVELPVMR
jgi:predicted acyl esterase